ncbi:AcrR family transcriptional regulator [Nocardia transvalensis]|uniref:AcrR family transcriptional regulator n=1 Tax=Nocardia transvalensis TaxID=37333 RepID=A0A7W9P9I5_9NOCA|nr:TetR/AcrR family transcriptional regulator [Nocardia transvalensis]MBB5911624.1 AcrR family transcriptional regulator [Nocardia transvalensis]
MESAISDAPSLRDRKKRRTRQTLIDVALERFVADGFDATTLDQLCTEVEVSKRTFFRYFTSKEDVAMAPTQDLWTAFLAELETRPPGGDGLLLDLVRDTLVAALGQMPAEGWAERVRSSRTLAERVPSMNAHGLEFCDRTTRSALTVLNDRFGFDPHDPRPRLVLDLTIAAFHWALDEWTRLPRPAGPDTLATLLGDACAAARETTTLTISTRKPHGPNTSAS